MEKRSSMVILFLFTYLVSLYGRAPQNTKEMEAPGVHEHNNSEWVGKLE